MESLLNIATIGTGALLTLLILLQARGASLGAGFGGSGELHTTRRGADKTLHYITVVCVIVFVITIVLTITSGK